MTVRLRAHHLLCILTFVGEGYSPEFVANFRAIAGRIADGEPIALVEGPDDVCAPLLGTDDDHCTRASVAERDRLACAALAPQLAASPIVLDRATVAGLRARFRGGETRAACGGCPWHDFCGAIARDGYAGGILP